MIKRYLGISIVLVLILTVINISFDFKYQTGFHKNEVDTIIICKPEPVLKFQNKIKENSGLIFYRNLFWTFNDSGSKNFFYSYDSLKRKIVQKFVLAEANNVDWEDIAHDSSYIYIGDFGNNFGNRRDLVIYKIPKKYLSEANNGMAWAEEIKFTYPEQTDFTCFLKGTEYDCEAFSYYNGFLYLFTKDWINRITRVYQLPVIPGTYNAKLISSFDVDGLITASDISPDGKTLALLGYKDYTPYLILFTEFSGNDFFSGKKIRLNFISIHDAQTEGITFTTNSILYISSEKAKLPAQLYRLNIDKWKDILYKPDI